MPCSPIRTITEVEQQPLFRKRSVKNRLYVVITSNSGLAGAYNANVLKLLTQSVRYDQADKVKSSVITIGNKGVQFVRRLSRRRTCGALPGVWRRAG